MSERAPATVCDVAIVGGGMVGASLALALAATPLRVMLVESFAPGSSAQPSFDDRTTALGNGTRHIFEALGAWPRIAPEAAAIRAIHVSEAGRFGIARLDAAEHGVEAFGYVAANRVIGHSLWSRLQEARNLELRVPARAADVRVEEESVRIALECAGDTLESIETRLLVAADGAQSTLRETLGIGARIEDYGQIAVVANLAADRPHDGTAYERFTPTGPLALLPLHDGSYTIVWTLAPERAREVLALGDRDFLAQLQGRFGWRAGRFVRAGRRGSYPLALTRAEGTIARRAVLIGNAAQALHPVAGQGFNLGLRDAATLAEVLAAEALAHPGADAGAPAILARFGALREADRSGVTRFTDGLVKLFGDSRPGLGLARNFGLLLFDLLPPAKSALSRVSWGFAGRLPRLARGLPLA